MVMQEREGADKKNEQSALLPVIKIQNIGKQPQFPGETVLP
jgi:hypothetical protein